MYLEPDVVTAEGWRAFRSFIEPVVALQSEYTLSDLMNHCILGEWQSWVVCETDTTRVVGAMATRIVEYESTLKACIIVACATEDTNTSWESMRKIIARVEEFARFSKCDVVRILGRPGWGRVFTDYQQTYVCFDKTVGEASS